MNNLISWVKAQRNEIGGWLLPFGPAMFTLAVGFTLTNGKLTTVSSLIVLGTVLLFVGGKLQTQSTFGWRKITVLMLAMHGTILLITPGIWPAEKIAIPILLALLAVYTAFRKADSWDRAVCWLMIGASFAMLLLQFTELPEKVGIVAYIMSVPLCWTAAVFYPHNSIAGALFAVLHFVCWFGGVLVFASWGLSTIALTLLTWAVITVTCSIGMRLAVRLMKGNRS